MSSRTVAVEHLSDVNTIVSACQHIRPSVRPFSNDNRNRGDYQLTTNLSVIAFSINTKEDLQQHRKISAHRFVLLTKEENRMLP